MTWLHRLARSVFGSTAEEDFSEEAALHLRLRIEENLANGLTPEAARLEAQRRLGNPLLAREQTRDADTLPWLTDLSQDLRYAIRALRQAPTFTASAIAAMAVGIGAPVAMFSLVNAVLLRPLPYPDPASLVALGYTFQGRWVPFMSPAKFVTWQRDSRAFEEIAAFRTTLAGVRLDGSIEPRPVMRTSAGFFALLGARPVVGRTFAAADDQPGAKPVVLLSHRVFRRDFGGDVAVLGRTIEVDRRVATVIGVIAPEFDASAFGVEPDVWLPLQLDSQTTDHPPSLWGVGRLATGATLAMANAQAHGVGETFHRLFPDASAADDTFRVAPLTEVITGRARQPLLTLMGAVTFVLLLACANVANLLLVRASARQREMAVRSAIGAGRGRLVRQLLAESLLLSGIGGLAGFTLGQLGIRALLTIGAVDLPRLGPDALAVAADWRVVAFTIIISIAAGVGFGLAPIVHVAGLNLRTSLSGGIWTRGVHATTVRNALVVGQVAVALVLVSGAALLVWTLISLRLVDRGFTATNVLTTRVLRSEDASATTARLHDTVERSVAQLQALPGVVAAAATCCLPLEADWRTSFSIVGRTGTSTSDVSLVSYRIISPQYLDALSIPLRRGRGFTSQDIVGTPAVALINQAMARRFWRDADPLGDQILVFPGVKPDEDPPRQIVGIVGDTLDGLVLTATEQPTVYVPLSQLPDRRSMGWPLAWIIRTRDPAPALVASLRTAIDRTSDGAPVAPMVSLDDMIQDADRPVRFSTAAFTSFALVALLLACVGVAAVIAVVVQQRTPELSVRLALGATPGDLRWLMLRDGLRLIVGGIALGWVGTALLNQWLIGFLFRVEPASATAPLASAVLLLVVGVLAVWGPAQRATRISPTTFLRST